MLNLTFMKHQIRLILLLLIFKFFSHLAFSLDPLQNINEYKHKIYKHKEGLPQYSISSIAQTHDGYLWFGTNEGLARFDGSRFIVYDKISSPIIKHNTIKSLLVLHDGTLCIGTVYGLTFLKNHRSLEFSYIDINNGLLHPEVTSIIEISPSLIWAGTLGGGISVFKNNVCIDTITTKNGLLSDIVNIIVQAPSGTVYVGGPKGISVFSDNKWSVLSIIPQQFQPPIRALYVDSDNTLWIGTDVGLFSYQPFQNKWKHFTVKEKLPDNRIRAILKDSDNNLWIGTYSGLARLNRYGISTYTKQDGLSNNFVSYFYEDREKSLWVGTFEGGVNHFYSSKFKVLDTKDGLLNEEIRPIYQATDGSIWVGTNGGGITRYFKNGNRKIYTVKEGLPSNYVRAIGEDPEGGIWVGTGGFGVARITQGKVEVFNKNGLGQDYIFCLFVSKDTTVWIGTREAGLVALRKNSFKRYTKENGLPSNTVRHILQRRDGSLWFATNNGIAFIRDGHFHTITSNDGLSYDIIYSLYEDDDSVLWIGTYGGGLNRLKDGIITSFTKQDGLYDNGVFQILEDAFQNLWLTSNRGIFRVNKSELSRFAAKKIHRLTSVSYTEIDGMKNSKCNGSAQPAGIVTTEGQLWIPTMEGVVIIDPKSLLDTVPPPDALIEDILLKRKPVQWDSLLTVEPNQNDIEFHFTAVSFIGVERIHFEYILQGYDSTWIFADNRRFAFYSNLPPNNYTFRVRACNRNGLWSTKPTELKVVVLPFIYQTLWFKIGVVLFILSVVLGIITVRDRRLRKREQILQKIVNDRTEHLQLEIEERKKAEEELRRSRALYYELVETAQDLVWQCDSQGKFVYLNPAWEKVLGYKPQEMIGKHFSEFQPPQFAERDKNTFRWVLQGNSVQQYETIYLHKNKSTIYIVFNSKCYTNNAGEVVGVRGTAYDITERKQVEQRLRESEERYRNLVHQMPIAILILRDKKIFFANPAAVQLFGFYNELELWGKNILDYIESTGKDLVESMLKDNDQKSISDMHSIRCIRKDGSLRDVEIHVLPVTIQNIPIHQVILHDVTEKKLLQDELLRSQKLQSLGTLAGGIAHDFNNILSIIIGYATRLEDKIESDSKLRDYTKAILTASERGATLVRQILMYARKTSVEMKPVHIHSVVSELFSLLRQTFPRIIELKNEVPDKLPPIQADQTQIHQALLNLCVNARDAMPNGGVITIKASLLPKNDIEKKFPQATDKEYLCVTVQDTGVGMDDQTKKRIFDPFFTTKEVGKGTGLGLSVVYGIIQTHHGFIDVETAPHQGSTFFLYLPLNNNAYT